MLLWFKESPPLQTTITTIREEYRNYFKSFISLCRSPGMGRFFLGFFFFNDALLTAANNMPIYLEQVFHVSDKTKSLLLVGILITSALGAVVSGWIADKIGLKKSLIMILLGWLVIFPVLGMLTNFTIFTGVTVILGFFYGATWAVCRAVMVYLTPKDKLNHGFSYYTLAERFSSFVFPVNY